MSHSVRDNSIKTPRKIPVILVLATILWTTYEGPRTASNICWQDSIVGFLTTKAVRLWRGFRCEHRVTKASGWTRRKLARRLNERCQVLCPSQKGRSDEQHKMSSPLAQQPITHLDLPRVSTPTPYRLSTRYTRENVGFRFQLIQEGLSEWKTGRSFGLSASQPASPVKSNMHFQNSNHIRSKSRAFVSRNQTGPGDVAVRHQLDHITLV